MERSVIIQNNADTYSREIDWLNNLINMRLEKHFSNNSSSSFNIIHPDCKNDNSIYANWIKKHELKSFERLVIISSLAYIYTPSVFDKF